MNLLFLVEGGKTEPKIYKSWVKHVFPELSFVVRPEDMTLNTYRIIAGCGYPNMVSTPKKSIGVSRLEACIKDINDYQNVNHFFICVDSEEESYEARFNDIKSRLDTLKYSYGLDSSKTEFHIIIQYCCIESWALGNSEIPKKYISTGASQKLSVFQDYYNVLLNDPENMLCSPAEWNFATKQKFHRTYLQEYFKEYGLFYNKNNPRFIDEKEYLDALTKRCTSSQDLNSLRLLLNTWNRIKNLLINT